MTIDMRIPGDPAAIRATAEWLDPDLKGAAVDADLELAYLWGDSQYYWGGAAGNAFRDTAMEIRRRSDKIPSYLGDAAEVFRAYANRLERGKEDFDDLRSNASDAGLVVLGEKILPPTTSLQYCPGPGAPTADVEKYNNYLSRVGDFNEVARYVGTWWGELDAWVAEHMAPLTVRIEDFRSLSTLVDGLTVGNEDVVATAFEYASIRTARNLSSFRESAQRMQSDADRFSRGLRSGNPAVRAAAEAANPRAIRRGLDELTEAIGRVTKYSKVIPIAGGVTDVVSAGVEIANGQSPSSVGVGLIAGAGGGALMGSALASTVLPPVGVAVVVGVTAAFVGQGGRWLYEAWTPLDVRESIDDFFTGSPPVLMNAWTGTWAVGTR